MPNDNAPPPPDANKPAVPDAKPAIPANNNGQNGGIGNIALQWVVAILAFAAVGAIIYALYQKGSGFLASLQNLEAARGLITFLVVFTTVIISITLVAYVATSSGSDVKDRFGFGKEILTALIGILGTILGFYFGQSNPTSTPLQVTPAYISNLTPKIGDSVVLYSVVSGGKSPYKYSITFNPSNFIDAVAEKPSQTGVIQEEVKISDKVPKDKNTEFTFQIAVTDSTGKSVTYEDKTKKFTVEKAGKP